MSSVPAANRRKRSDMLCQSALCGVFVVGAMLLAGKSVALPTLSNTAVPQFSSDGSTPGLSYLPSGTELDVTLNAKRTIIDWLNFNIGSTETVQFLFGGRSDIVLNRTDSQVFINGVLTGKIGGTGGPFGGNVWVYSPNGVVFGTGAQVDVGGLLATTALNASDAAFLDTTQQSFDFAVPGARDVINKVVVGSGARITGHGGTLAFIAAEVDTAAAGRAGAAAQIGGPAGAPGTANVLYGAATAYRVRFAPNSNNDLDLFDFVVPTGGDGTTSTTPLNLNGVTNAGNVYLAAVSQASVVNAVIQAPGVITANAATGVNGDIVLTGGRSIVNQGVGDPVIGAGVTNATIDPTAAGDLTVNLNGQFNATEMVSTGGNVDITAAGVTVPTISAAGDVTVTNNGGGIHDVELGDITAGDDIRITSFRDVSVTSATLTGTGVDSEGDGRVFDANASGSFATLSIGNDGAGFLHGATTTNLSAYGLEGAIDVNVADSINLTTVLGRFVDIVSGGDVNAGTIYSNFHINVTATGAANVTTAITSGTPENNDGVTFTFPSDIEVDGASVNVGKATAFGDVVAHASAGDATVGTAVAGDDIIVLADAGNASLTTARLTALAPDASDPSGLTSDGDGRRLLVQAHGSGSDARLGLGVGRVFGGTDLRVLSDRDAIVDLLGDATLTQVDAGRDATVTVSRDLNLTSLSAGDDVRLRVSGAATLNDVTASGLGPDSEGDGSNAVLTAGSLDVFSIDAARNITARAIRGDNLLTLASAGRDTTLTAANGLVHVVSITPGSRDVTVSGKNVLLDQLAGPVGRDLTVTTGGGFEYSAGGSFADITAGRNITINAGAEVALLGNATATKGDVLLHAGTVVETQAVNAGRNIVLTADGVDSSIDAVSAGALTAGQDIKVSAPAGTASIASADAGRDLIVLGRKVNLALTSAPIGRDLSITATGGGITATGDLTANRNLTLDAKGALTLANVTAVAGDATLSGGGVKVGAITAGGDIAGTSTGATFTSTGTINAGKHVTLTGKTGLALADVKSVLGTTLTAPTISVASVAAGGRLTGDATAGGFTATGALSGGKGVTLSATGALDLADVTSGSGDVILTGGNVKVGAITGVNITGTSTLGAFSASGLVDAAAGLNLTAAKDLYLADISAGGDATLTGVKVHMGGASVAGLLKGRAIAGNFTASGNLSGDAGVDLGATGKLTLAGVASKTADVDLLGASVSASFISAGGAITGTSSSGDFTVTGLTSGVGDVRLTAAGNLTLGDVTSSVGSIFLNGQAVSVGAATASAGDVNGASSVGDFTATGTLTGQNVTILAKGSANLADVSATVSTADLEGAIVSTGAVTAGATIKGISTVGSFTASGDYKAPNISIDGLGGVALQNVNSDFNTSLNSAEGSVSAGAVNAAALDATAAIGDVTLASVTTGNDANVVAGGLASIGTADVGGSLLLSGATVSLTALAAPVGQNLSILASKGGFTFAGTLAARNTVVVNVAGSLSLADVSAAAGDAELTGSTISVGAITAGGDLSANATGGDFTATGLIHGAHSVALTAAGALTLADVTATVGRATLTGASVSTGAVTAGKSVVGSATAGDYTATGLTKAQQNVTLTATGAINVADVTATTGDIKLTAASISSGALDAGRDLIEDATGGGLSATGTVTSGRDVDLTASGALTLVDVNAVRDANLQGASVSLNSVNAGRNVAGTATTGGFKAAGLIHADQNVALKAAKALTLADVTTKTGNALLSGGSVSLTSATIAGGLTGKAKAGDFTATGAVSADSGVLLSATGALQLAGVSSSGGSIGLTGGSVNLATADAFDSVTGTSTTGDFTATGLVHGGQNVTLTAAKTLTLANLTTTTGDIGLYGADVTVTSASAARFLVGSATAGDFTATGTLSGASRATLTASGALSLARVTSLNGSVLLTGGSIQLASADAAKNVLGTSGGDFTATGLLHGGGFVDVIASKAITLANVTATNGPIHLVGTDVTLNSASTGGLLTAAARTGDLTATGTIHAGKSVSLDAAKTLTVANVTTTIGDADLTGADVSLAKATVAGVLTGKARAGDFTGSGKLTAGGSVIISATGALLLPNATTATGGSVILTGGSVNANGLTAGADVTVTSTNGAASVASATAGDDVRVGSKNGNASLTDAVLTGTGLDNESDGRVIAISATGAGSDATLGGSSADTISGATSVTVDATHDATVILGGNVVLTSVSGGNNATVQADGVSLGTLIAGVDGSVTALKGDAVVANGTAGRDLGVTAASGLASVGLANVTRDLSLNGASASLGAGATVGRDLLINTTAAGFAANGDLTAGRNVTITTTGLQSLNGVTATTGDVTLNGPAITSGLIKAGNDITANASAGDAALGGVDAGGSALVTASGVADLKAALTKVNLTVTGATVTLDTGATAGGAVSLTGGAGGIGAGGAISAGSDATLSTSGAVGVQDVTAKGGVLSLTGASIQAAALTSGQAMTADATGGDLTLTGLADAGTDAGFTATGAITTADVTTGNNASFTAGSALTTGDVTAGGIASFQAASITGGQVKTGGDLYVYSSAGGVSLAGATSDDDIYIGATGGDAQLGSATLTGAAADLDRDGSGPDTDGNGRVLSISSDVGDVRLGLGTGSVSGATETDLTAGRDVIADLTGTAQLTNVSAGRNASLAADTLGVDTATAGGDLTATSRLGDLTAGQLTATGGLTIDAAGKATIGAGTGDVVTVLASDLDITDSLAGRTVSIQSRGGDVTLGDGVTVSGLAISNAEFGLITASESLSISAGLLAGGTQGNMAVGNLDVDPSKTPLINLLAGGANQVSVSGAVTPLAGGGTLAIGDGGTWTPKAILISGSIGSANGAGGKFSNVHAFDSVQLTATEDILMGAQDFIDAVQAMPADQIDVVRGKPNVPLADGYADHVFIASASMTVRSGGKIVQQNTSPAAGRFSGLYLTNNRENPLDTVLTIGGNNPVVIDLFGSFIDGNGKLIDGQAAALAKPAIALENPLDPNERYRFNGCVIFSAGACTPELVSSITPVLIFRPDLTVESLTLTSEDATTPDEVNPDITGAGNEEIWRKRRP